MSYLPAALLFFKAATPLLYSPSLKGQTFQVSPSVAGGSTCRFGLDGMVPLPLTRSWWATWLTVTRHGGLMRLGHWKAC